MSYSKDFQTTKTVSCVTVVITDTQQGSQTCTIKIDTNLGQEEVSVQNFSIPNDLQTMITAKLTELGYSQSE
jgi:hypothetical protein